MTRSRWSSVWFGACGLFAAAASAGCAKVIPRTCAPGDALCQSQMGALNDPSCKNGSGSNAKCLDPRAP